jgi:hypothetical protein
MMRDKEGDHGAVRDDDDVTHWRIVENLVDGRLKSHARLVCRLLPQTQRLRMGEESRHGVVKVLSREIGDIRSVMLVQALTKPPRGGKMGGDSRSGFCRLGFSAAHYDGGAIGHQPACQRQAALPPGGRKMPRTGWKSWYDVWHGMFHENELAHQVCSCDG